MSRSAPNSAGRRARPLKQRKPRGLGKGPIPFSTLRESDKPLPVAEPLSQAEWAHAASSFNRRLPLS